MFLLIGVFAFALKSPGHFAFDIAYGVFTSATAYVAGALGAYDMFGYAVPTAVDVPAIAEATAAVFVFESWC